MISGQHRHLWIACAFASLTAACGHLPRSEFATSLAIHGAPIPAPERVSSAIQLLGQGQPTAARAQVVALLKEHPADPSGRLLLDQIDMDPRVLMGDRNFAYKVKSNETMASLAGRFLGDRRLFYALARYNRITIPNDSVVGRTLLIPGAIRGLAIAPRRAPRRIQPTAAPAVANVVSSPTHNPLRATQLRASALDDLSGGRVDSAVGLLRQAAQLDPASNAIQVDLARAQRIQSVVRNQP